MTDVVLTQSGSFDFRNLSEVELEVIVQVIQKDFEIKASEKARLRRHRRKLKEADERVSILANSNFNESFCVICFKRFVLLFFAKRCCISCRHSMCRDCSVWIPRDKEYICLLCQNERTLKSMACDWYYGLLKNRFQHDASELVAQSLYSNQGQYSINLLDSMITPDLLQKVKGAQISRYRQNIQCKWEEMQERLRRLDRSAINRVKREEAYRSINEEYKTQFRNVLKEFSQVLYITLENYAARTENCHLNINELVMETVHEEVELLIGYKINLIPEDMQSVVSDVESTVSMFMGNQLEDKLAAALINKINEDYHKVFDVTNYDIDCLDNIAPDDQSSSTAYLYRSRSMKPQLSNGINGGYLSSLMTSNGVEVNKSLAAEYATVMADSSHGDSDSDFPFREEIMPQAMSKLQCEVRSNDRAGTMAEVALSANEVQHILKYPNASRSSVIERYVTVPHGEPINLLVDLNGITQLDVTWIKSSLGRKTVLQNGATTEMITSNDSHSASSNLRIWQSKQQDSGLYTAYMNNQPIAVFDVNIIETDLEPSKPTFRLKMINCSVRNGHYAEFIVEAVGNPNPRLEFYHNNTILNIPSNKYSLEHVTNINRVILRISRATASDNGTYKCVASNKNGSCECTADLQVTSLNFRFEKKMPVYEHSSGSSIDGDTPTQRANNTPFFKDHTDGMFDSNASVNQTGQGGKTSPTSPDINMEMSSDTVIGRELPDDMTRYSAEPSRRCVNSLPRSGSVGSDDSGDISPNTIRANALRSSTFLPKDANSNVAKIREMFNQPLSPPFQRSESITKRTPPVNKRKLETQLTREVRVRRDNSLYD